MKKASWISATVAIAASAVVLAGCSTGGTGSGSGGSSDNKTRACIILPDTTSSPRWEAGDRPALTKAFKDAGFDAVVQNAQGDESRYATLGDQELNGGCGVMILTDYNSAGVAVAAKAKKQDIPVIAYDRPLKGADYYVSFDNEQVGALEGQSVVDGLKAAGKDPATASVVFLGGDPKDGNAAFFKTGATKAMAAAGITKPAFDVPGTWDGPTAGTRFEQAYTSLGGKVDAVWAANDTNAAAAITVLDKNGKTVPVSGQDASVAGLQNVLLGKQTATVYKPYQLEATAASDLAIQLLKGKKPSVSKKLADGTPYIATTPVLVGPDSVQKVVSDGNAKASDICTADVAAACAKYGVK